ncbi:MAG: hypothetical protein ABI543_10120 [Ignavibacteria bacterium]
MQKIKFILLLISLFSLLSAFSCNSSDTKTKINEKQNSGSDNFNNYFPLKESNKWVYINEGPRDETELFTVQAKDVKKVDGGIQLKVSSFPYLTKDNEERSLTVKSNGEIEISNYMGTSGVFIPKPNDFKISYKWSFGVFNGTVNSGNQTIATEDGTYNDCYYIMMTDGFTFSFEMWFKKDVGIVKWGANRTNPPQLKATYYVLKEHTLN